MRRHYKLFMPLIKIIWQIGLSNSYKPCIPLITLTICSVHNQKTTQQALAIFNCKTKSPLTNTDPDTYKTTTNDFLNICKSRDRLIDYERERERESKLDQQKLQ